MRWSRFLPLLIVMFAAAPLDVKVTLDSPGGGVGSPRGIHVSAGAPYRFEHSRFFAPIDCQVRLSEYADSTDPVNQPKASGDFVPRVIPNDGVRVWVNDALELESWKPHESRAESVPLHGGVRRFKVCYYEAGGFAGLRLDIQRR
jgi:hypothetical protein